MDNIDIFKKVTTFVVGMGVGKIVSSVVKNNIEPDSTIDKVAVATGSVMLGMMVADATKDYTRKQIDEAVEAIQKIKKLIAEKRAQIEQEAL